MWKPSSIIRIVLCIMTLSFASTTRPQSRQDATVRVRVNLAQTDVMVFDRAGRFVPGLTQDQFELQIDGKRHAIASCDMVSTGSERDESLWTSAPAPRNEPAQKNLGISDLGRSVLLFVDDWHISSENLIRSREALADLIDNNLGISDRAAIFSASRNLGFLQQLTDNKAVLHAALHKLTFSNAPVQDKEQPPMSEAQALAIEQNEEAVLNYFIDAMLSGGGRRPVMSRASAEKLVRRRASALASESVAIAERTLASLNVVLRAFSAMPGRKVLFFLSDGFVLQTQRPEILNKVRQATTAAAHAGIVIYSLDTRGLIVGGPDSGNPVRPDISGRLARTAASEALAAQDVLNALAADTGGKFLKNTNALGEAIIQTMAETSRYYLLGWYLEGELLEAGKYRSIRVMVKGRPDLKVRVRQGKVDLTLLAAQGQGGAIMANPIQTDATAAILQLLRAPFPIGVLPIGLRAGFDLLPDKGSCLSIAVLVPVEPVNVPAERKEEANRIELAGVVSNSAGDTVASFSDSLIPPWDPPAQMENPEWIYSGVILLNPGIYQVRIAVRDARTGHCGSAIQWVEIPEFSPSGISVGSILLRQGPSLPAADGTAAPDDSQASASAVKRVFPRSSQASYYMRVFNPAGAPIRFQTRLYVGNHLLRQSEDTRIEAHSVENGRMLIQGTLPLAELSPGAHTLEIVVKVSPSIPPLLQKINFWVQ
jgi:VWFA-related protein